MKKILFAMHDEMLHFGKALMENDRTRYDFHFIVNDFRFYDVIEEKRSLRLFQNFRPEEHLDSPVIVIEGRGPGGQPGTGE